ncbi:hypothetical protein AKJ40_04320 [candidate division MSBL1 archaeon SCGC-AAA259M10]|nr:hypothetical protein AKJ62_04470 [candidate division MSBL1 archaeon SCGC-AAA259D14]KXA88882.1 hypothetical protein AKJ61_04015 [candidate division MSBL1 archaeon SCGC-AAA259B11]KXA94252.1 hypothetical protein AKJ36_03195 [candidate division MSBL1 archaeon SCGC-AAA259I07]KXA96820.1 hypothetical protein AKJ39_04090 [candidate division MSBL1 archaeon SCGC-AAA259J03]KXA98921.1 hypothetical protein AKJ40_04320 [candidate division MSBL1 archaeon SCGC-AAA259M10]KXA99362.1 hypothetical protein AKJ4
MSRSIPVSGDDGWDVEKIVGECMRVAPKRLTQEFKIKICELFAQHRYDEIVKVCWNELARAPMSAWDQDDAVLLIDTINSLNAGGGAGA